MRNISARGALIDPNILLLKNAITCFWNMDEASGSRADLVGSQTMSATGTPPGAAAINNNGITISSGNFLTAASSATLQTGNIDFTVAFRVFVANITSNQTIIAKGRSDTLSTIEYDVIIQAAGTFAIDIWASSSPQTLVASNFGLLQINKWYDVIAWVDTATNTVNIEVNGVLNSANKTITPVALGANVAIGAYADGAQPLLSGIVDDVTFSKSKWTKGMRNVWRHKTYPFNTGIGIFDTGQKYTDWGNTISGAIQNILIPTNGISGTVVLYTHGSGESYDIWLVDTLKAGIRDTLLQDGHILCVSDAHDKNWGNDTSNTDYVNLYNQVTGRFPITRTVFLFQSMGALNGLKIIQDGLILGRCAYLIYPVCSLTNMFGNNLGTLAPDIRTAYGILSDGSDFAARTVNHDPVRDFNGTAFNMPMRFTSSPSDTVVDKVANTDAFRTIISPYALVENSLLVTLGNHGDPSNFISNDVKNFFDKYPNPS